MTYSQLDEKIVLGNFEIIKNLDFRKVTSGDYDNWDIEYESDYFYKPNTEPPLTFLEYPVLDASFYLTENQDIKSFGLRLYLDDADGFYGKMVEQYGEPSIVNQSNYYFQNHGIELPVAESEKAKKIIASIPFPLVNEYKDMRKVSWYDLRNDFSENEMVIRIYNYPIDHLGFDSPKRILRILFEEVEEMDD
ncbi:hypothetical protein [Ulvibacterium sp.]|uniref:hypothetical protein n=1 Tax=Ulvibacterium sp. TaxID=2665914 RepID=UPI00260D6403|nr:hypothetical protein [Ulvibacterium sp.]